MTNDLPEADLPLDGGRRPGLTRRLRALLHTLPLGDLRRSEVHRDPAHQHYDFLALAVETFDHIVERASLEREADAAEVVQALRPLLHAMDATANVPADPARHETVGYEVVGALCHAAAGRRPFEEDYSAWDGGPRVERRVVSFQLLGEGFAPGGRVVLRLSPEAQNLFLNALDLDIEDAQTATKAVIQRQLARGRFRDATASAQQARLQSVRLREKIDGMLGTTRRDLRGVNWGRDAPALLEEAVAHLDAQLLSDGAILEIARERLTLLEGDSPEARQVAAVAELIENCHLRHLDLFRRLIGVRQVFLDEQDRQAFAPPPSVGRADPLVEVLEPLLRAGEAPAGRALEAGKPALVGPWTPRLLTLSGLLRWHLQPRREGAGATETAVVERDWETVSGEAPHFPLEAWERAESHVGAWAAPGRKLSGLLRHLVDDNESPVVRELVALLFLRAFAPDEDEEDGSAGAGEGILRAERTDEPLAVAGFFGDDLGLSWTREEE